jgi:hypothetical protein
MMPEYLKHGARLPRGGPDRVRLCIWYADNLDKGQSHDEALSSARNCLRLLHMYASAGIVDKLGPLAGGIPVEFLGEE